MAADSFLDRVVADKRAEVDGARARRPRRDRPLYSLRAALTRPGVRVIYECKRLSPSAGVLLGDRPLSTVVAAYHGIADAISVVTDKRRFGGSLADLAAVAARVAVPVLRKDFIVDPVQVVDAYAHGADAVLLMLSVLDDRGFRECAREAARRGLDVLTEVHDDDELERALALDARIIGINNRSFADLSVDTGVTARLAPRVPAGRTVVCESGIATHGDLRALAPLVDAFLVGTALMCAPDIALAARTIVFGEVKVCGLTTAADARAAWAAGASWGGLVFADSPRRVDVPAARAVAAATPLPLVGVFVDAAPAAVAAHAHALPLAAVQLHGAENAAYVAALRPLLPPRCAVWRALRVGSARPRAPVGVDRVLYDRATPGTGTRFDWALLPRDLDADGLAGGIDDSNVDAALATGAGLLDVSSGVESAPGRKSPERLAALFDAIRRALARGGR